MKTVLAVLFGGQASEHPVSLMSAASMLENLSSEYELYLVGITRDGRWYHYSGPISSIENDQWEQYPDNKAVILSPNRDVHGFVELPDGSIRSVDVIFPLLHGRYGEDGMLPALCELAGIPYVATNMTSSALAMDKHYTHIIAESAGIPMARWIVMERKNADLEAARKQAEAEFGYPFYVKPCREGSSFGCHKISSAEEFAEKVSDAFRYDDKILLEEFIDGYEVGAGVMGYDTVGEVFEIIVASEMYGFAEKYDGFKTVINTPATTLSADRMAQIRQQALKLHRLFGCDIMSRVDFFMSSKGLIFNEINTMPGFTSHSLFPASFRAQGWSYQDLLDKLIELARERG